MFIKAVFINQKNRKKKYCEILLQFQKLVSYFNILQNIIYFSDAMLNYHQPLLQSSVSHDPSEIILIC